MMRIEEEHVDTNPTSEDEKESTEGSVRVYESDLTAKEKRALQRAQMKEMNLRQKIRHIFTYYKIVFVAIFAVVMIVYIGVTIFHNAQKKTLISIAIVDVGLDLEDDTIRLEDDLLSFLGTGDPKEEILLDTNALSGNSYAAVMKMSIVMSDGVTDVLICDQSIYDEYKGNAVFKDWKEILGEDYANYEKYMKDEAISLQESTKWKDYHMVAYDPVYMVVLSNSDKDQEAKQLVSFFFDE